MLNSLTTFSDTRRSSLDLRNCIFRLNQLIDFGSQLLHDLSDFTSEGTENKERRLIFHKKEINPMSTPACIAAMHCAGIYS